MLQKLIAANPQVPARLIIGDERVSANPKLNNCVRGWDAARHEWIILADSNVLMPRDYIQRLLAAWKPTTGLVCSMPQGSHPQNIWAELEIAFLNTYQARWQYAADGVGTGFAQGKNMLWRRDILDAAAASARSLRRSPKTPPRPRWCAPPASRSISSTAPSRSRWASGRCRDVWSRQIRWARMRRKTFPLHFLPEILSGSATPAVIGAYAGASLRLSMPLARRGASSCAFSTAAKRPRACPTDGISPGGCRFCSCCAI